MPSNHLILCCPLLLPSIFPNIRVFSKDSALYIRWPKYWSFSFNITPGTAACQASLSIPNSWSLLKLMSMELVMLFNGCKASVLQSERSSSDRGWWWLLNSVNALNGIELYSKNGSKCSILCYVYFIIKKWKKFSVNIIIIIKQKGAAWKLMGGQGQGLTRSDKTPLRVMVKRTRKHECLTLNLKFFALSFYKITIHYPPKFRKSLLCSKTWFFGGIKAKSMYSAPKQIHQGREREKSHALRPK